MGKKNDDKQTRILDVIQKAVPRVLGLELSGDNELTCTVHVPREDPPLLEEEPLAQRQFFRETGLTKVEKATLDYLAHAELRELAGGELNFVVKRIETPATA